MFNTLSWARSGLVRAELGFTAPGPGWLTVRDESGREVPSLAEGARRHPDGTLAAVTLAFRAADVPALGYRTYWATPAPGAVPGGPAPDGPASDHWEPQPGTVIENETFLVEADPARGGTLTRIVDKRTGAGLLAARRAATSCCSRRNTPPTRAGARARGCCPPRAPAPAPGAPAPRSLPSAADWAPGCSPS